MAGNTRILIVEDEGVIALELQDRLTDMGYEIVGPVPSGQEAIDHARELQPDVVLMDIILAGQMDGIEASEIIKNSLDIPVIFLTAHADERTLQRAKATQPFGYILKPFNERELQVSIEMALYKHQKEKTAREREEWLSATLTSIGDAVITVDVPITRHVHERRRPDADGLERQGCHGEEGERHMEYYSGRWVDGRPVYPVGLGA